jgi:hypothetical protein
MASEFAPAFSFVMSFEDPRQIWEINPDLCSEGKPGPCFAVAGINSSDYPEQFAAIQSFQQAERGPAIQQFYEVQFWTAMNLGRLESQDLANRVLDEGVWSGPGTALILLQRAVNSLTGPSGRYLYLDGVLGPETLQAANAAQEEAILAAYRRRRIAYLQGLKMYQTATPRQQESYMARASA